MAGSRCHLGDAENRRDGKRGGGRPPPGGDTALPAGGILLNNDTGFIDRINELVYPAADSNMQRVLAGGSDHAVSGRPPYRDHAAPLAMPQGGTIFPTCEDAAAQDGRERVRLTLRDTGTGMDNETLSRILDPFFATRGTRGTGLGLSICQTLINRHMGRLDVQSAPGQGSTFSVWLPAERQA